MRERFVTQILLMTAGLIIWAAHLGFVYGLNALACTFDFARLELFGMALTTLTIGVATLVALGAELLVLSFAVAGRGAMGFGGEEQLRFMGPITATLAGLSAVAVLWQGLPVLVVPACAGAGG